MTRPACRWRPLLALVALLASALASAIDTERAFEEPALQARYERMIHELRCVQCLNQSVAESNAPIAMDLRREVRRLIADGRSDEEIREFMLQRYGDFVLYRPRLTAMTALLWAAPALLLLIAVGAAVRVIRSRAALPSGPDDAVDGDDQ